MFSEMQFNINKEDRPIGDVLAELRIITNKQSIRGSGFHYEKQNSPDGTVKETVMVQNETTAFAVVLNSRRQNAYFKSKLVKCSILNNFEI